MIKQVRLRESLLPNPIQRTVNVFHTVTLSENDAPISHFCHAWTTLLQIAFSQRQKETNDVL